MLNKTASQVTWERAKELGLSAAGVDADVIAAEISANICIMAVTIERALDRLTEQTKRIADLL